MAEFYSARGWEIPPLPWTNLSPPFSPNMAIRYREQVTTLVTALNNEESRPEAAELLRSLIDKIVLIPGRNGEKLAINIFGDPAGILNIAQDKRGEDRKLELDIRQIKHVVGLDEGSEFREQGKMVASPRNHISITYKAPHTPGLSVSA